MITSVDLSIKNGGSLILIKNNLHYKQIQNLNEFKEEITFEISAKELPAERLSVLNVYTYQKALLHHFLTKIDLIFKNIIQLDKYINYKWIVCGDVDVLKESKDEVKLCNLFECYNGKYRMNEPSRITTDSSTCIDNIFSNFEPETATTENLHTGDHHARMITFPSENSNNKDQNSHIKYRKITTAGINILKEKLKDIDWELILADLSGEENFPPLLQIVHILIRNRIC